MNKLMMKARSGVTLVELLVVILIVTILSVSMLPLLQPFVTESQYAAEAIPVLSNIRTKIGLHVYEKNHLPYDTSTWDKDPVKYVQTWRTSDTYNDVFEPSYYEFKSQDATRTIPVTHKTIDKTEWGGHINNMLDLDYQDLKGKRSKPLHYQYLAISTNTSSYVIACFGDGNGLKAGTGYAVCELNFPTVNRKMIGTWKRYKSYNDAGGAIVFTDVNTAIDETSQKVLDCYVPKATEVDKDGITSDDVDGIVTKMTNAGWEF